AAGGKTWLREVSLRVSAVDIGPLSSAARFDRKSAYCDPVSGVRTGSARERPLAAFAAAPEVPTALEVAASCDRPDRITELLPGRTGCIAAHSCPPFSVSQSSKACETSRAD